MRTVGDTLGVKVGLHVASIDANPFKVDFVLDVGHENESSDNTLALGGGGLCANLAVPDVVGGGEQCSDCALSHGQEGRFLAAAGVCVDGGHALRLPVDLGGIAEILVDGLDVVQRIQFVGARLADGVWHARIERVRKQRVASAETKSAHTTVAIH